MLAVTYCYSLQRPLVSSLNYSPLASVSVLSVHSAAARWLDRVCGSGHIWGSVQFWGHENRLQYSRATLALANSVTLYKLFNFTIPHFPIYEEDKTPVSSVIKTKTDGKTKKLKSSISTFRMLCTPSVNALYYHTWTVLLFLLVTYPLSAFHPVKVHHAPG